METQGEGRSRRCCKMYIFTPGRLKFQGADGIIFHKFHTVEDEGEKYGNENEKEMDERAAGVAAGGGTDALRCMGGVCSGHIG